MGGCGASSGMYTWRGKVHIYGDEYHSIMQWRNVKFVKINEGATTAPMETMTKGRIYVTVGKNDTLKSISWYSKDGKRRKQIDLTHAHKIDGKRERPHVHLGYKHDEGGNRTLTLGELHLARKIERVWANRPRSLRASDS